MKILKSKAGFTFIEVLVVAVLIAILATIAMITYTSAAKGTRDSRRVQDASNIRAALEMYKQNNGIYPNDLSALTPEYLPEVPEDPSPDNSYEYLRVGATGLGYTLTVHLENDNNPLITNPTDDNAYVQEEPK